MLGRKLPLRKELERLGLVTKREEEEEVEEEPQPLDDGTLADMAYDRWRDER